MSENKQNTNLNKKKHKKGTKKCETSPSGLISSDVPLVPKKEPSMENLTKDGPPKQPAASAVIARNSAGSNWLQANGSTTHSGIADEGSEDGVSHDNENIPATGLSKSARLRQKKRKAQLEKYVAIDCEMVGVGFNGQEDMLARVSIVNKRGEVLLDKFVKPQEAVTDYRTSVSGIRPHDIENAEDFKAVQEEVVKLLQGKILVGHAIRNDLAVLHIKHPFVNIRDTARYKPLCRLVANGRTPSLKRLSQAILGLEIQTGEHNSIEDARAAMNIYNRLSSDWEKYLKKHQHRNCK